MEFVIIFVVTALCVLTSPVHGITFIRYPSDVTAHEGDVVTFHCSVRDKGDTYVYWQKNKSVYLSRDRNVTMYAPIHPQLTERLSVVGFKTNRGKFSLRIHDITTRDQGIYQCVYFQNMFSYYSPEARLTVLPRRQPSLLCSTEIHRRIPTSTNKSSLAAGTTADIIGSNIQLTCEEPFTGQTNDLSSLYWYKSGEEHSLLRPQYCITSSLSQKCVYSKEISVDDLDVSYGCLATNHNIPTDTSCQLSPFISSSINVTISPPVLLHTTRDDVDNATFTCSANSSAAENPQFQWFLNGQHIEREKDGIIQNWNFNRLTLENINVADNGTVLTCVIYGDNGSLGKGRSVLLVQGNSIATTGSTPPGIATTQSANVTSDNVYVSRNTSRGVNQFNDTKQDFDGIDRAATITGITLTSDELNMSVSATLSYGSYSPSDGTVQTPGKDITATTTKPPDLPAQFPSLNLSLNDFPVVVAAAALVFAAMCLLVLANVTCYIVYKKHRNFRNRRYTLAEIRPGLNDSILLGQLSPKSRQKYSQQRSVSSFYSESDGKRSSSQLNRIIRPRTADSSGSETFGNGTEFWISSESDTMPPKYSDRDLTPKYKSSSKKRRSDGSSSSAQANVHYRVIDPLRSDSVIESVKLRELEVHVEPTVEEESKSLDRRTTPSITSSSEDDPLPPPGPPPRYLEQLESRRCVSLNAGVIPPWHKQPKDRQETPAYAVCNLLGGGGGKIHLSKSFCHNRPTQKHLPIHKKISTRSLQEYAKRRPLSSGDATRVLDTDDTDYDNNKPLRSPRPTSEGSHYDNFKSATAVGAKLYPDLDLPSSPVDLAGRNRRHSFSSATSLELEWDTSPCAHNLSQSDPELDHRAHDTAFFAADQPLPLTPVDENFDTRYDDNFLSVGEQRRHPFVQRQRSFSDTCKPATGGLDVINESFNSNDPISNCSSDTNFEPSPPISPIRRQHHIRVELSPPTPTTPTPPVRRKHDKVVLRQKRLTNRPRPTSEPIRPDYIVGVDPNNAASASDKSLVLFPPYRIQSISGGTDLTDHWMSANASPNTKRKSVRLVRDPSM